MTTSRMPRWFGIPHPGIGTLRAVVLVVGLWYLGLGIAGFSVEGSGMGLDSSRDVLAFGVSGLLNIGHTGVGVLGLAAAPRELTVRAFGWLSFFAFTGLFVYSLLAVTVDSAANLANVEPGNIWLYGVTALLGLFVSIVPARTKPNDDHGT